jgi:hypothetical protein
MLDDRLNWSSQRPQRQHPDGDDAALARWREQEFPRILSEAVRRAAHLAFVDETGFMLNPTVRRTYAPRGKTPAVRVADPHARLSVIGAITVDPKRERVGLVYNLLGDIATSAARGSLIPSRRCTRLDGRWVRPVGSGRAFRQNDRTNRPPARITR